MKNTERWLPHFSLFTLHWISFIPKPDRAFEPGMDRSTTMTIRIVERLSCAAAAWVCLLATAGIVLAEDSQPKAAIVIAVGPNASSAEKVAANDLLDALQRLYPQQAFDRGSELPPAGRCILLGTLASNPGLTRYVQREQVSAPESFVVTVAREDSREIAAIAGADPRGVAYGVDALLEKLGYGFYLSYDAIPAPKQGPFSLDGWSLADKPLVRDRIVFDWHNFLSGCSTWNLPDWHSWIRQSQKMGYNAVMVHAYGNNPMVRFSFNGQTKPVGFLSTTAKGRDWSTMHVNDVRRLWGGEAFVQPAFGADAALGPDDQRADAARALMRGVFAYAGERGMEVYFADDVDTVSANPQELILTLPDEARFPIGVQALGWMNQEAGRMWLANPDTPEGYGYYREQVEALLAAYPQITCLVVWFRTGGTPWMELPVAELRCSNHPPQRRRRVFGNDGSSPPRHLRGLRSGPEITFAFIVARRASGGARWSFRHAMRAIPPEARRATNATRIDSSGIWAWKHRLRSHAEKLARQVGLDGFAGR
jgi:hypothetical protein